MYIKQVLKNVILQKIRPCVKHSCFHSSYILTTNPVHLFTNLRVTVIKWIHGRHPMGEPHTISDRPSLADSDGCTGVFQVPVFCGTIKWACHQVSAIILRAQCDGCKWETGRDIYSNHSTWQQQLHCLELGSEWTSIQFLQIHNFIHTSRSHLWQKFVPEKGCINRNRTNKTQNSHLTQSISCRGSEIDNLIPCTI